MHRTRLARKSRGESNADFLLIVAVDGEEDHRSWLYMHICKFSYLKGSIRVTLSQWQLKGLLFFCLFQRLMNIPMPVSNVPCAQVENCMKNITRITACTNTDCVCHSRRSARPFHWKQITCDWDYGLVKVALLWCVAEFLSFSRPLSSSLWRSLDERGPLQVNQNNNSLLYYLLKALIAVA